MDAHGIDLGPPEWSCPVREKMSRPRDFLEIPLSETFLGLYDKKTVVLDIRRCQEPNSSHFVRCFIKILLNFQPFSEQQKLKKVTKNATKTQKSHIM